MDVALVGAGITGLWLRAVLHAAGYSAALIEYARIGGEQTLASQGIIHGGLKYALRAVLTQAARASAAMPARWRAHLRGIGAPDLSALPLASDSLFLYANGGLADSLTNFLASKSLHGRNERLNPSSYPEWMASGRFEGLVYRLDDFALDVPKLIACLAMQTGAPILHGAPSAISIGRYEHELEVRMGEQSCSIRALRLVLCGGAGNSALLGLANRTKPHMQLRPLHQVWAHAEQLPSIYAHCVSSSTRSAEPRLTITTQRARNGMSFSLGGALATQGVERSASEQEQHARAELAACLPWLRLPPLRFEARMLSRAEPQTAGGQRPDRSFLHYDDGIFTCWPTKLTLVPELADRLIATLDAQGVQPRADSDLDPLRELPMPPFAEEAQY